MGAVAGEKSIDAMTFFFYFALETKKHSFLRRDGRKRYFHIDENASSKQI